MKKVIVLENIRSLHNVGSIFRTADAAGFDTVFLCGYTGTPPDRRIEKVSLGAENFLEWKHFSSSVEAIEFLKQKKITVYAIEQTDRSKNLLDHLVHSNIAKTSIAIVFGNEVEGVSSEALDLADQHFEIPMRGQKTSLNVSVCAGIALYQFLD